MIAATVLCLLALAGLLVAVARGANTLVWVMKPLASAAFVAVGVMASAPGPAAYKGAMVVGLVLAAGGDVALIPSGHVAYAVACASVLPVGAWVGPLALAPLVGGAGVLRWLWPRLGAMRVPVVAYVTVIGVMVVGAMAVWRAGALPEPRAGRLALGATLFWLSDLAVARERFVVKSFANRTWGLAAYYVGQLLLAWSLAG
jgi:uncharacterized membrane protein YhhN